MTEHGTTEHSAGTAPSRDGSAASYSARQTLPLRAEVRRQLGRRRTQFALGFLVVLPFLLLIAFTIGTDSSDDPGGKKLVDLATTSGLNFVTFTLFASIGFLLVVIVALFFGDTVASEASWSSLKYLLVIPVPRGRLLRQKAVVAGLLSLTGLVVLPLVALLVGVAAYGPGEMVSPTGQALPFWEGVGHLALAVAYIAVQLTWVAGLALLLSTTTDAPLGAVGGAVLVSILSQILNSITALGGLREYLPTHFAYAWSDFFASDLPMMDWNNVVRGVLSALIYAAVFVGLAARHFSRKDVTS